MAIVLINSGMCRHISYDGPTVSPMSNILRVETGPTEGSVHCMPEASRLR